MKQMRMTASLRRCSIAVTAAAFVGLTAPVLAQEPSAEHLSAARGALDALDATDQFDVILPNAAQQLKTSLIQTAPNLVDVITVTVDETALGMAGRRADLEREAAAIYAKNFTVEELNAIRSFYEGEAGQARSARSYSSRSRSRIPPRIRLWRRTWFHSISVNEASRS
ncbi:MAG: DUF2059 domain-containing protein, partial [Pseudomonadota bacterium]